jgi:hypothetical protein
MDIPKRWHSIGSPGIYFMDHKWILYEILRKKWAANGDPPGGATSMPYPKLEEKSEKLHI